MAISPEAKARVANALAQGKLVMMPERPVLVGGTTQSAWYEIDPITGQTVGVLENGLHGFMETAFNFIIGFAMGAVIGWLVPILVWAFAWGVNVIIFEIEHQRYPTGEELRDLAKQAAQYMTGMYWKLGNIATFVLYWAIGEFATKQIVAELSRMVAIWGMQELIRHGPAAFIGRVPFPNPAILAQGGLWGALVGTIFAFLLLQQIANDPPVPALLLHPPRYSQPLNRAMALVPAPAVSASTGPGTLVLQHIALDGTIEMNYSPEGQTNSAFVYLSTPLAGLYTLTGNLFSTGQMQVTPEAGSNKVDPFVKTQKSLTLRCNSSFL